ncbi:MAG: response regulator [Gammaproteobacteria bacterium]|nr:response regulator [Gammaproteobacteria bacterium]
MAIILLVDDSNTEIHVFSRMLEKHGHTVLIAKNGHEALTVAAQYLPDLILMDIVMPEMDGFQATRRLRGQASTAHIPIAMLSAKDQQTDHIWAERQGAQAYIVKPVEEQVLIAEIERLLNS